MSSGKNLMKQTINKVLKNSFKNSNLSSKSFRAAIPSILANFPKLINDKHVMGWGRWKSKVFSRYQKFKTKQRKWVFKKLCHILHKDLKKREKGKKGETKNQIT